MQRLLSALKWVLRCGPLVLGLLAVALLGLGVYLQFGQNETRAQMAAALVAGPPAAVDVAAFDATLHMTDLREATVRGQAAFDLATPLIIERNTSNSEAFMVPLVSSVTGAADIVGIALYHEAGFRAAKLGPEVLLDGAVGIGSFGPILDYNGKIAGLGIWDGPARDVLAQNGLTVRDDLVVIWPYMGGRDAAFAPPAADEGTIFGLMSKIAGVIGLLALAKLVVTRDPDKASQETEFEVAAPDQAMDDFDVNVSPAGSRFSLRKVLIGIVGVLFAVGLATTVWDLIAPTLSADKVVIATAEERAAQSAAAALVPDADPDRHWTEIDVGPMAEWAVAQYYLAVGGDKDAQLALGKLGAGVVFALFMVRFFFRMRRSLRPKTTVRFDSMGIN